MVKRTDIGADDEAGTGMSDFLGSSEQDIDGAEDHDEVAIPPELRDYWATQAELDVRAVGFSDPEEVDMGMAVWSDGLRAGIIWSQSQLDALDDVPFVCSGCNQMWPADAYRDGSSVCQECESVAA